jgi:hypothetical protein
MKTAVRSILLLDTYVLGYDLGRKGSYLQEGDWNGRWAQVVAQDGG